MSEVNAREKVIDFFAYCLRDLYKGLPVIQSKQDIAIEYERYLLIDLMAEKNIGNSEKWVPEKEEVHILGLVETTLNIRAFGTGSVEVLSLLNGYLTLPTIVDKFQEANIAVNSIGSVMDLTDLIDDSRYVEEAAIDLTVSYDRDAICNPGWFETVFIEGKLTEKGTNHVIASGVHFEANINIEKENE
ncbi:phage neck terminator protein [Phascolarctobacterium faecium]|uniref:phage neck terminator protein n=1 Tax=Phascolarctobacterium faecium TaxID=33025 RepID=UPI003C6E743A